MAFRAIVDVTAGLIGKAMERDGKEISLVHYFVETVDAVHETALRQDPDTYKPLGRQFETAAGTAENIIDEAVEKALERGDPDAERVLKRVCDRWTEDLGRPVPQNVTYQRGDIDRCATLQF